MSDTTTPDPIEDVPPSQMEPDALTAYVRREVRLDWEASGEWREEARSAYDFVAGRQWDEIDIAKLNEEKRPAITFNRVAAMIDAVCGAQVNNRNEIKFLPRAGDDGNKAELLNGVARWVMDQTDSEDEDSEAFRDVVICGLGWTETRMDYEEDPEGKIVVERRDPFEMGWDRSARRRNLSDANHVWSRQRFSPEQVASRWPEFAGVAGLAKAFPDAPTATVVHPMRDQYAEGDNSPKDDTDDVTVTHFQWCERRTVFRVLNPATQEIQELTPDEWAAVQREEPDVEMTARYTKATVKCWYQVFECGGEVTTPEKCPDEFGPTFKCITGKWDRNRRVFYGLVRAVKDPQMWANKWLSQSLHIINTNAKSGVFYEEGAVKNTRKFEEDYAKTGSAIEVAAGALSGGRIQPKVPPPFPQAFDRLMQFAIASMPDVTGINRELLGTVDREQPGILEAQRKQASQAVLAPLFDALRRYHKAQGRLLMVFMAKFLPPGKMVRIVGPDGNPQDIQWLGMPETAQFDVVVDQAPTSPNQKSEVWLAMQPMLPVLVKEVPAPVLLKLLRFSPLPESVVNEIQQEVQKIAQQPPPPDPALEKIKADVEAQQAKTQMDLQMKQADMQMAREKAALDYETELRKAEATMQIKRIEAENQMAIERMKAEHDARIKAQAAETDIAITERKASIEAQKRTEGIKAERDILAESVRPIVEPMQDVQRQMAEFLAEMSRQQQEGMQHLYALVGEVRGLVAAEKEIVRGPDGRVAGARIKQPLMN